MLTPVDIQQKKFHIGLGYEKKDVNAFFEEVVESYEQLYRSNAELKEKVITLTDGLQNYKSKEAALRKSLMLAEKDSEDTKTKATKEAKNIELEARNKAKAIIGDAEKRLSQIKAEIALLETQYAAYKSNFCNLMKQQFEFLKEKDFDLDAQIDERSLTLLGGAVSASQESSFGAFNGDPQMRDQSTLGGMSRDRDDLTSTSAVYTSVLNSSENFVDPFNPNKDNGRYNPYDGRTPDTAKARKSGKSNFTVNTGGNNNRNRNNKSHNSSNKQNRPHNNNSTYNNNSHKSTTEKTSTPSVENPSYDRNKDKKPNQKENIASTTTDTKNTTIPTVDYGFDDKNTQTDKPVKHDEIKQEEKKQADIKHDVEENELVGDVEISVKDAALIGDDVSNDDANTDEFGFEFI